MIVKQIMAKDINIEQMFTPSTWKLPIKAIIMII